MPLTLATSTKCEPNKSNSNYNKYLQKNTTKRLDYANTDYTNPSGPSNEKTYMLNSSISNHNLLLNNVSASSVLNIVISNRLKNAISINIENGGTDSVTVKFNKTDDNNVADSTILSDRLGSFFITPTWEENSKTENFTVYENSIAGSGTQMS